MHRYSHSPWTWSPPLVAALLLTLLLVTGANQSVFLALNRAGHALGDNFWLNLTMFGDGAVALALVVPAIKRSPQAFWAALIAALIAALFVQGTKQMIDVPRPLAVLAAGEFFQSGPGYRAVSFPSGHAAASFAIAGIWIMGLTGHHLLRALLLVLAVLVSLSRVMVGVHWPIDLLGGMLGGWFAAWCGLAAHMRWGWKTSGLGGFLAGLVLLVIAGALMFSNHIHIPVVLPLQRTVGAVCFVWGVWEMLQMLPGFSPRRHPKGE